MRIEERDGSQSRDEIAPLFSAVYPPKVLETIVWRDVKSAKADRRAMLFDDDNQLVSVAGLIFRDGLMDERPVRIGGIGGVMTYPTRQGQGFGKAIMLGAHEIFMRDPLLSFGLLFCEPKNIPFYQKLDWQIFTGTVIVEQPTGTQPYQLMTSMVRSFHDRAPQDRVINIGGLPW